MSFFKVFLAAVIISSVGCIKTSPPQSEVSQRSPKDGVMALQKAFTKDGKETPILVVEPKVKVGDVMAPDINFGKVGVANNDDQLKKVAYAQGSGSAATVFVRDGSDFVRISTTILNAQGKKVLGTKLAVDSPAYGPASRGEAYCGEAKIVDFMFDTCYEPIRSNGETIGLYLFAIRK